MDKTHRQITKIARAAQRYSSSVLSQMGVGSTEFECLRLVRCNQGTNQEFLRGQLNIDKAAVARMIGNLEKKGYLVREKDPQDKRSSKIYTTEKALEVKEDRNDAEGQFYEWLLEDIPPEKLPPFLEVLEQLCEKARAERAAGYLHFKTWLQAQIPAPPGEEK